MTRLAWPEVAKELADFLDTEGNGGAPDDAADDYWYQRGAIEFAQHLKAAMSAPLT